MSNHPPQGVPNQLLSEFVDHPPQPLDFYNASIRDAKLPALEGAKLPSLNLLFIPSAAESSH